MIDKKAMNRYMSRHYDPIIRMGKHMKLPPDACVPLARKAWRDARDRWRCVEAATVGNIDGARIHVQVD